MTDLGTAMDPRVLLVMTIIGLGATAVEKLRAEWAAHGADESVLNDLISEAQRRIDRRADPVPPTA